MPITTMVVTMPLWLITLTPVYIKPIIPNTVRIAPNVRFKFMLFDLLFLFSNF